MLNRVRQLPLQKKVSATMAILFTVFAVASYGILRAVIAPAFDDLETGAAGTDLMRAERALQADVATVAAITADWGPWDDIYFYATGQNPGFRRSNLGSTTLENLDLDFLAVYGERGRLLWSMVIDGEQTVPVVALDILDPERGASAILRQHDSETDRRHGILASSLGPVMVSSHPILHTDQSGPVAGAVVMGRYLDDDVLAALQERTGVQMAWSFGTDGGAGIEVSRDAVAARSVVTDLHGSPYLLLETATPRSISTLGSRTLNTAMLFLAVAGVLVTGFTWVMLQTTILGPIETLTAHVDGIRESGDLSRQLGLQRDDEIGKLAAQFDGMTMQANEARKALLDQSFKAGKADTAAEVLHNIRNVMTPMVNGVERLQKMRVAARKLRIRDATAALRDPDCPPGRRDKFLDYIDASYDHLGRIDSEAAEDLQIIASQAHQVEGILADQEKFANVSPVSERLRIGELLNEATHVIPRDRKRSVDVTVDTTDDVEVHAHRIGLLQVLGNLVLNAYESIRRTGDGGGRITLAARDEVVGEQAMVRVTVRDTGTGFDRDTQQKIFQRGFTSKTSGETTGLGLHWTANAVASMGGQISADSGGRGRGAEFHVLLPAARGG